MNNIYFIYNFNNPSAIEKIKFLRDNGINVFAFEKDKPVFSGKEWQKRKLKNVIMFVFIFLITELKIKP